MFTNIAVLTCPSEHAEQVSDKLPDPPEDQDDFTCLEQILEINTKSTAPPESVLLFCQTNIHDR